MAGIRSLNGYNVRLVANGKDLELYSNEDILIDTNTTELFAIDSVPSTYTKTILLPGSKVNNEFFKDFVQLSLVNPQQWVSSNKIRAFLECQNNYLVDGYISLVKVNIHESKLIDSYEIMLFGIISNVAVDLRTKFLTETVGLAKYNHTASWANVTASWKGELFNGDIVYQICEQGQQYYFSNDKYSGINSKEESISLHHLKPAIRLRRVYDAMLEDAGYSSTGSWWQQDWLNDVYLVANNNKTSMIFTGSSATSGNIDFDEMGTFKVSSATSSIMYPLNGPRKFPYVYSFNDLRLNAISYNSGSSYDTTTGIYHLNHTTALRGKVGMKFTVKGPVGQSGLSLPYSFSLDIRNGYTNAPVATMSFDKINQDYYGQVWANYESKWYETQADPVPANRYRGFTQSFDLEQYYTTPVLPSGSYAFGLFAGGGLAYPGTTWNTASIQIELNGETDKTSFLEVTDLATAGEGLVVDIPANMPKGTAGIRQVELLKSIQQKFNLALYQDRNASNLLQCETFNEWYKIGQVKDFNLFINESAPISIEPLSMYSINKLEFTDKEDPDFVSKTFKDSYNRTFSAAYYQDTQSYFSQGEYKIETSFASAPLVSLPNIGGIILSSSQYLLQNIGPVGTPVTYSYSDGPTGDSTFVNVNVGDNIFVVARSAPYPYTYQSQLYGRSTFQQYQGTYTVPSNNQMAIPYYIADKDYKSAIVSPRIFFYNGLRKVDKWQNTSGTVFESYPYFDHYSADNSLTAAPTTSSRSLLFTNETPIFGTNNTPTSSLLSEYWNTYLQMMYKSNAKILKVSAVMPIAAYGTVQLNDLVSYRSDIWHLRSINNYSLTTGECDLELLGPIIPDALSSTYENRNNNSPIQNLVWNTASERWQTTQLIWNL